MDKHDAAEALQSFATLLELTEETPFRARAYAGAARSLEVLEENWQELAVSGRVTEIRGIGKGLAATLKQLAERFDAVTRVGGGDVWLAEPNEVVEYLLRQKEA